MGQDSKSASELPEENPDNSHNNKPKTRQQNRSQAGKLEQYRIALDNLSAQTEIATALNNYGYDSTAIESGKTLYQAARSAYESSQTAYSTAHNAHQSCETLQEQLSETFRKHRKLAQVAFRDQAQSQTTLGLKKPVPTNYIELLDTCQTFYDNLCASEQLKSTLSHYHIGETEIAAAQAQMTALENARSLYQREKAKAQDATDHKNQELQKIEHWMRDFYAVAKIALQDQPQLLEALGKHVPSH